MEEVQAGESGDVDAAAQKASQRQKEEEVGEKTKEEKEELQASESGHVDEAAQKASQRRKDEEMGDKTKEKTGTKDKKKKTKEDIRQMDHFLAKFVRRGLSREEGEMFKEIFKVVEATPRKIKRIVNV